MVKGPATRTGICPALIDYPAIEISDPPRRVIVGFFVLLICGTELSPAQPRGYEVIKFSSGGHLDLILLWCNRTVKKDI
jgi:hypothetical protein